MRVYTYLTTHTQRFHHCRKSHGMGRHIVSHEALNYLKVIFVCLFVWMSQKNTLDTQLRKTESKTVQVICRVGSCVNDGILFYFSVNLAWFSENELSHSDNEKRDFFFFFERKLKWDTYPSNLWEDTKGNWHHQSHDEDSTRKLQGPQWPWILQEKLGPVRKRYQGFLI